MPPVLLVLIRPLFVQRQETVDRSVVSFFNIVREEACRQCAVRSMMSDAFAAFAFSATWVATVAVFKVTFSVWTVFRHNLFHSSFHSLAKPK